jgi:CelD/BcsL family acetyltransferase involved in cellulose biosynthesis
LKVTVPRRLRVRVHRRIDDVPACAWDALAARPPATANGSRAWVAAAFATSDRDRTPCLLAVEGDDGGLLALLPLAVDPGSRPVARLVGTPHNDLNDVLVRPGRGHAAKAIVDELRAMAERGYAVDLDGLDPDGALAAADVDRVLDWSPGECAPVVDLHGPWATAASAQRRAQWNRALRRLRRGHRVELRWTTGVRLASRLPAFLRMREARLRDKGHPLDLPPVALIEQVVPELAGRGRCALAELAVDGRAVAQDLYLLDRPVALLWLRALDGAWRRFHCGHLLLRAAADSLAADRYDVLDLGWGAERYKFFFGAEPRRLLRASAG